MPETTAYQPRVFISHSSQDKPFARKLIADLTKANLDIWFDERELKPGDSIVQGIADGLRDTDYLVVVLSEASVHSHWVRQELNTALMQELSGKGTTVVPVRIDNCEIPTLLQERLYADFRTDYNAGLHSLLRVFSQESETVAGSGNPITPSRRDGPDLEVGRTNKGENIISLSRLTIAQLRRLIIQKLTRSNIASVWFDVFESRMDDDMAGRNKEDCVIELLMRAKDRGVVKEVADAVAESYPHVVNP